MDLIFGFNTWILHGPFRFLKIFSSWKNEWDGSNPEIMIRDGLTKTYSQVKNLNDSVKMVPDNQPVTEWFQLSSPSTWGWEGDQGKFVFFFLCTWWRWDGCRECMRERERGTDSSACSRRCTQGVPFPQKRTVFSETRSSRDEDESNAVLTLRCFMIQPCPLSPQCSWRILVSQNVQSHIL